MTKVNKLDNGLYYTDGEIRELYTSSKDKHEQIHILAELNLCSEDEIRKALIRSGLDFRKLPRKLRSDKSIHKTDKVRKPRQNKKVKSDISKNADIEEVVEEVIDGNITKTLETNITPDVSYNELHELHIDLSGFINNAIISHYDTLLNKKTEIQNEISALSTRLIELNSELKVCEEQINLASIILHK